MSTPNIVLPAEAHEELIRERDEAFAEIERLRAKVEALREALADHRCIVDGQMIVSDCVKKGYCGCCNGLLLR
jgi:hypothetical protein